PARMGETQDRAPAGAPRAAAAHVGGRVSQATIGEALMRPAYAAALLGFRSGRALRRYVLERERETGAAILVRVGQGRSRPTYRVSLARLRQHCPELFPELGELARGLRELLERTRRMHELLE